MEKEYHILSLSGGKDSTALAFFMKENMPEIFEKLELVFCDTEHEIPETYAYLNKIEVFLNKQITRLKPKRSFCCRYAKLNTARRRVPSGINTGGFNRKEISPSALSAVAKCRFFNSR